MSGTNAQFFSQYTVKKNYSGHGFVTAVGNICIASNDPALEESIDDGLWYDEHYARENTIFAPYFRPDSVDVDLLLRKNVVIEIELAPLSEFAEYYRKISWQQMFKSAMYLRFADGRNVTPYFGNHCPYDLNAVYKDSDIFGDDGLLSTIIATPEVSIFKERIDLNSVLKESSDAVKSFSTFSNAFEISVPATDDKLVKFPGSSLSFISHIMSVEGNGPKPPTLRVSDAAYSSIKSRTYCGEFYGALRVINSDDSKSFVVMNGIVFEVVEDEIVVADFRVLPSKELLNEQLPNFQVSLMAAEARLKFLLSNGTREEGNPNLAIMRRYLLWLGATFGQGEARKGNTTSDIDPVFLQARAMYLAKLMPKPTAGASIAIPHLKYDAYRETVNSIQDILRATNLKMSSFLIKIRQQKDEECQAKQPNEAILKSGALLLDFITVQANYQEEMSSKFASMINDKKKEVELLSVRETSLYLELQEQQSVVQKAVSDYKEAVSEWESDETIKTLMDIGSNLFTVGFSFTPPDNTLKDLFEMVQRIQKAGNVFNAVIETYRSFEALPNDPQKVVNALSDVGHNGLELLSSLEWKEVEGCMDASLVNGPAQRALSEAFSLLVVRGQALIDLQNDMQSMLSELAAVHARKRVHDFRQKHLSDLRSKLDDASKELDKVTAINFVGLSSHLMFFHSQMLLSMASAHSILVDALQYEYLQSCPAPGAFSFFNLQFGILAQAFNINKGLTARPMPMVQPEPIIFEVHGVKPESLTGKNSHSFDISINKREFDCYNKVRVSKVEAEIGGILSTKSGKYFTELKFDGNPFMDRDFNGNPMTFQTVSRLYTFLHDVSSSCHHKDAPCEEESEEGLPVATSDTPFGNKLSSITPFSAWTVSLPPNETNEGIKFENCPRGVTIRLTFHISAQLIENASSTSVRMGKALMLRTRDDVGSPSPSVPSTAPVMTQESPDVSKSAVLDSMASKSVTAGWDAVFSVSGKQVNANLRDQHAQNPDFLRSTGDVEKVEGTSQGTKTKTFFNFEFKAPKIEFLLNNSVAAKVIFPIAKGRYVYSAFANEEWIQSISADITEAENYSIEGIIPLVVVPGATESQKNISLNLSYGRFSAENFKPSANNPSMDDALNAYFTQGLRDGFELYNLATLDTSNIAQVKSLIPSKVVINVYHSPSNRDILQLFIASTAKLPSSAFLGIREPFPTTFETSLIVSSKTFFDQVIPASSVKTGLIFEGANHPNNQSLDKPWSSAVTTGYIVCDFKESKIGTGHKPLEGGGQTNYEFYADMPKEALAFSLIGMKIECGGSDWGARISLALKDACFMFKYGVKMQICQPSKPPGAWSKILYKDFTLKANFEVTADVGLAVVGRGQNQLLKISVAPSATGTLERPSDAPEDIGQALQKFFIAALESEMKSSLEFMLNQNTSAVTLFALKNILFPCKNMIVFKEAYVPGDLVVFGNFKN